MPHSEASAPAEEFTRGTGDGTQSLAAALLAVSPHVLVGARGMIWVDARGLSVREVGDGVLAIARAHDVEGAQVGIARAASVAEIAATSRTSLDRDGRKQGGQRRSDTTIVESGKERDFLALHPIAALAAASPVPPSSKLLAALADIGVERCADLAALTLEEIEVRFGAEGVALWRLSRADDPRRMFAPRARVLASASLAWEEYALRDTERLAFVINRLAGTVCAELGTWGEAARGMTLTLALTSRTTMERQVRSSRPTASRATWVRLLRAELDRIRLRDAVVGLSLRVDSAGEIESPQGDIFDRGLQSVRAVEDALTRLLDDQQATIVGLTRTAHPRPEDRVQWRSRELTEVLREHGSGTDGGRVPSLSLQLLPRPRRIAVETTPQRDHHVPVSYRERAEAYAKRRGKAPRVSEVEVLTTVGPDRISGGMEVGEPYARDYYQCVTADGLLVLLYRDALADQWYLHGWWD